MKKNFLLIAWICIALVSQAQKTDVKFYQVPKNSGEVVILSSYGEFRDGVSYKTFQVKVPVQSGYYLSSLSNLQHQKDLRVFVDGSLAQQKNPTTDGWQYGALNETPLQLRAGVHEISFAQTGNMIPMVDELFISRQLQTSREVPASVASFLNSYEQMRGSNTVAANESGLTEKVLPNPEGAYNHAIDTAFTYSHFSIVYLSAGNHTMTTSSSTTSRILSVFTVDYSSSFSNVNGGAGGESQLNMVINTAGYYFILLRAATNGSTGTTNINLDGSLLVSGAVIGGKTYSMSSSKTGRLNFFTCQMTGTADTRMSVSTSFASSVRGYNDDYNTGTGDWDWNTSSRIKKTFTEQIEYGFVCAYSPSTTGTCDIYLGNLNSDIMGSFENLKSDDAINTAPYSQTYNCISWSGGITTTWVWPLDFSSPWYNANPLTAFDKFYSNTPQRFPGAWNYTRSGVTTNNAVVDLWSTQGGYTHGSVRKPGNNNPHGYDWESKPGSLERTFHPRNALHGSGYGEIVNSYRFSGTYARTADLDTKTFETDEAAIKAGVAVKDQYAFSAKGQARMRELYNKIPRKEADQLAALYEEWKSTWAQNQLQSNPALYCTNDAYKAFMNYSRQHVEAAQLMICKYYLEDGFVTIHPLQELTEKQYGHIMKQVIDEYVMAQYNDAGKFVISNQYLNGVRYIDRLLPLLSIPVETANPAAELTMTVGPNPVRDAFTVRITTAKASKVSVTAVSSQTGKTIVLQAETELAAGTHAFNGRLAQLGSASGDMVLVNVNVDGQVRTIKMVVAK